MNDIDVERVTIGTQFINLASVASAHWEGRKLFVHLDGGRFLSMQGDDADRVWHAITLSSVDLRTGSVFERAT